MKEFLNKVQHMDCIEFLKKLPDNSVDSCVTDPPYGLEFMGKEWDAPWKFGFSDIGFSDGAKRKPFPSFSSSRNKICLKCGFRQRGESKRPACSCEKPEWDESLADDMRKYQAWCEEWAREILRVLKPGAHLLSFSGTRTYHRLACAIEDAGFEIRDQVHWLYGSGFPKGLNIAKAIDKRLGFSGIPVSKEDLPKRNQRKKHTDFRSGRFHRADGEHERMDHITKLPESGEAQDWEGWNTQLKPAHEPIVFARKPIGERTIVDNVLKHGTGGINIDGCRIAVNPDEDAIGKVTKRSGSRQMDFRHNNQKNTMAGVLPSGRYPANLILSHHPDCEQIQEGKTETWSRNRNEGQNTGKHGIYGTRDRPSTEVEFKETVPEIWNCFEECPIRILNEQSGDLSMGGSIKGSSSMIFGGHGIYGGSSPSRQKRSDFSSYRDSGGAARFFYCAKPSQKERNLGLVGRNIHVTVKPLMLMRWLVRLITPPDGIVLDPFLGSGTTAIAAEKERFHWLGCEISEEYCEIAEQRISAAKDDQTRLDDFS